MITSDSPITALPGVGEARAKAFKKLGVENIRGLLAITRVRISTEGM